MSCAALIMKSEHFNQTLLDCIEDAVRAILGQDVLDSLFASLETYEGLTRDGIPRHMDVFFPALEKLFGQPSGKTIGRFIIKVLYARFGLEYDSRPNRLLLDYVEDARRRVGQEQ